jgi:hypothetical protein
MSPFLWLSNRPMLEPSTSPGMLRRSVRSGSSRASFEWNPSQEDVYYRLSRSPAVAVGLVGYGADMLSSLNGLSRMVRHFFPPRHCARLSVRQSWYSWSAGLPATSYSLSREAALGEHASGFLVRRSR